jgi:hypothetical protein
MSPKEEGSMVLSPEKEATVVAAPYVVAPG